MLSREAAPAPRIDRDCPQCDTPLANVQGLSTCGECGWIDDR